MDVTISIADELVEQLERRAADSGQSISTYAARVVTDSVIRPTLHELLSPVRDDFERSGLSEDELMDIGRGALSEVRQSKQARSA